MSTSPFRWFVVSAWLLHAFGCAPGLRVESQQTDTWSQAPTDQVDVLWVIDDSGSMAEEQDTLIAGFSSFAEQLEASQTQFQIGVITTSFDYSDEERGVLIGEPPFLTPSDDYRTLFPQRTTVGIEGSDKEKGLEAAVYALHPAMTLPGGKNEGFVRKDAELLVIFVSDEDDCSDDGALDDRAAASCYTDAGALLPVSELVSALRDHKEGDAGKLRVSSIVGHPDSACSDVYLGERYLDATSLTGGITGDVCGTDWSGTMSALGLEATGIHTKFRLSRPAYPDTITVEVDGTAVLPLDTATGAGGFTYDTATWFLEFHGDAIPPKGAVITASYAVDPTQRSPG